MADFIDDDERDAFTSRVDSYVDDGGVVKVADVVLAFWHASREYHCDRLGKRIAELEAELRWYASVDNWRDCGNLSECAKDRGERARAALGKKAEP